MIGVTVGAGLGPSCSLDVVPVDLLPSLLLPTGADNETFTPLAVPVKLNSRKVTTRVEGLIVQVPFPFNRWRISKETSVGRIHQLSRIFLQFGVRLQS